jgi:hypothetical protein
MHETIVPMTVDDLCNRFGKWLFTGGGRNLLGR